MRGTTSLDGTKGTMRLYQGHSTDVGASWAWRVATDGLSGTWTFYEGDVALENQIAHLDWQQNADGSGYWAFYDETGDETSRETWTS